MKYYTETISADLAEKLKEKGMLIEMQPLYAPEAPNARGIVKAGVGLWCPPYAEVLDWLADREIFVNVEPIGKLEDDTYRYEAVVTYYYANNTEYLGNGTWHEAATKAIERALELI